MAITDYGTILVTDTRPASFKISDFKSKIGTLVRPNLIDAKIIGSKKVIGGMDGTLGSAQ